MSEKRFRSMSNEVKQWYCIESLDGEMFSIQEVVDLLNDQEEEIRKLQMENFALKRLCEEYIIKIEHLEKM